MDPFVGAGGHHNVPIIAPGPAQQQTPLLVRRTTRNRGRDDLRLEFDWHIPFTSRKPKTKKEQTIYYYAQQPQQPTVGYVPITPPYTPVQHQRAPAQIRPASPDVIFETIAPRTAVREHGRPRPTRAPTAPRETSRERRAREREQEARLLAEERAAIDARMEGLRAEQSARRIAREEALLARAHRDRIREIDAEIAHLQSQLEREQRHRRRAQGNVLHQANNPRAHRPSRDDDDDDDRPHDHHRPGFRAARQDPGGGGRGDRDGEPGSAGKDKMKVPSTRQRVRDLDREIKNLETKINDADRGRRRRKESLPTTSTAGVVNGGAPFYDPFRRVTRARSALRTVKIENRNTARRY